MQQRQGLSLRGNKHTAAFGGCVFVADISAFSAVRVYGWVTALKTILAIWPLVALLPGRK